MVAVGLSSSVYAFEGRYEIQGAGPGGPYQGTALVTAEGDAYEVQIKTLDGRGGERLRRAPARVRGGTLRFTLRQDGQRAVVEGRLQGGLEATFRDSKRQVVRQERWLRTERFLLPIQVVALTGTRVPSLSKRQAVEAQEWILAQLEGVFGPLGLQFVPVTAMPRRFGADAFDEDEDGRLSTRESRSLRDALELAGIKRQGRVVVVVTAADFAHHDRCRGWTLGDAPPSPHTLCDPNDNVSLVGVRYLDPSRYHTVAHEVAHQLGLDDLGSRNRDDLDQPDRRDHIMISGGVGLHIDPVVERLIRRSVSQFPHHGLEGRRGTPGIGSSGIWAAPRLDREGLPTPKVRR